MKKNSNYFICLKRACGWWKWVTKDNESTLDKNVLLALKVLIKKKIGWNRVYKKALL